MNPEENNQNLENQPQEVQTPIIRNYPDMEAKEEPTSVATDEYNAERQQQNTQKLTAQNLDMQNMQNEQSMQNMHNSSDMQNVDPQNSDMQSAGVFDTTQMSADIPNTQSQTHDASTANLQNSHPHNAGGFSQNAYSSHLQSGAAAGTDNVNWMMSSMVQPQTLLHQRQKRRGPSWGVFIIGIVLAILFSTVLSVGITNFTYDGARPSALNISQPPAEPVVKSTGKTPDWEAVAKAVGKSVVAIDTKSRAGASAGSGVIIDKAGHILTNDHVVSGAKEIWVKLADGRLFEAKLDGKDPATDLAVISLKNPPADLTVATLGNSKDLRVGEPVAAIGNPLGLSSTMTTGIVSALDRPVQTVNREAQNENNSRVVTNAIQLDAAVNPGNSGGPVFDAQGRVIGIASSIATTNSSENAKGGSIGLGFAIPIDLAKNIANQLIQKGVAEHAYLGVLIRDGIASYGTNQRLGAQIESVEPGTPAEKARLHEGDVVVAVNGRNVVSGVSLTGYVRQYKSGEKVTLTVARNGQLLDIDVTLAARPDK